MRQHFGPFVPTSGRPPVLVRWNRNSRRYRPMFAAGAVSMGVICRETELEIVLVDLDVHFLKDWRRGPDGFERC